MASETRERLRRAIEKHGVKRVSQVIGLNPGRIVRLAAGAKVRTCTLLAAHALIGRLDELS